MDIYVQIAKDFSKTPHIGKWTEIQTLVCSIASRKPKHWLIPLRACEAVGCARQRAFPAALAVAYGHIGIVLLDDMLDADPRGEYLRVGAPAAANMASALQSAALASIARCEINPESKLAALESINEMFLTTALGQYWDVQSLEIDEAAYWRIAKTKSSPFFGEAFHLGALMGGASVNIAARVKELGCIYGEMIQIHDDLQDAMAVPANPDWIEGRSPLPILFARLVDHPARARFKKLLQKAGSSPKALKEAQEILIRCGALSYCIAELLDRYQTVKGILSTAAIARPGVLLSLFDDVVAPVWSLFHAAGEEPFE
jgi:geranylgeranyl pyrophosphate synthase